MNSRSPGSHFTDNFLRKDALLRGKQQQIIICLYPPGAVLHGRTRERSMRRPKTQMGKGNFQQLVILLIWAGFACIHQNAPSTPESFLPPDFILPCSQVFIVPLESREALERRREQLETEKNVRLLQHKVGSTLAGFSCVKVELSSCLCTFKSTSQ